MPGWTGEPAGPDSPTGRIVDGDSPLLPTPPRANSPHTTMSERPLIMLVEPSAADGHRGFA